MKYKYKYKYKPIPDDNSLYNDKISEYLDTFITIDGTEDTYEIELKDYHPSTLHKVVNKEEGPSNREKPFSGEGMDKRKLILINHNPYRPGPHERLPLQKGHKGNNFNRV